MSSGRQIRVKGVKLDKSGKRIVSNPKRWDVSKQLRKKAGTKVTYGRRGR